MLNEVIREECRKYSKELLDFPKSVYRFYRYQFPSDFYRFCKWQFENSFGRVYCSEG